MEKNLTKRKLTDYFAHNPVKKKKLSQEKSTTSVEITSKVLLESISTPVNWKKIKRQDLDLDYCILFPSQMADKLFEQLEKETEYYSGAMAKVFVFGKWHNIPRKQVAYGDDGMTYSFSGNCFSARSWTPLLTNILETISTLTGYKFNFVLINRYKDGNDYIGEHRDDEKELDASFPIASLSLGGCRDFVFRHSDYRKAATRGQQKSKGQVKNDAPLPVTISLQHGSLLLMNSPTNEHWYHSLPKRQKSVETRINLTFRRIICKNKT